jgi:aspartyl aminopeptidase
VPTTPDLADVHDLCAFIDGSPSPFHAVATAAARLDSAGFERVDERDAWPAGGAGRYLVRGGSLVAWSEPAGVDPATPFRIVGAHTDSPNLRVKPRPDAGRAGLRQLAVEVYGGALLNSWLDRDLGLSGRLAARGPDGPVEQLVRVDRPVLRVPQLAIHLDREITSEGLKLNPQQHLVPVWGLGEPEPGRFAAWIAAEAGVEPADVLAWDLMVHDLAPSCPSGPDSSLVSAPRLDNLCSSWAAVEGLLGAHADGGRDGGPAPVVVLFDHEEIGSTSDRGADSSLLPAVLERVVAARGGDRDALLRALAGSACLSADMAHATHPNYADRHEPGHWIAMGGGPVLKVNSNVRYASDATSSAPVVLAAEQAGATLQRYSHRTDLPCGSTIGPTTAARLGIPTADVGAPQLAMHSARELMAGADVGPYRDLMAAFLTPADPAP